MFTLIKKTSVHKDTKVVSNQKYDAILGRIYTISHLLSLERHNRISKTSPFVKVFLVANFQRRFYIVPIRLLRLPGVECAEETMAASRNAKLCYISAKFHLHLVGNGLARSVFSVAL